MTGRDSHGDPGVSSWWRVPHPSPRILFGVTGLERIRRRGPVIVFLLLLVLVLLMVGFACACFSDQPLKAVERTLGGLSTPALIEMWTALVLVLVTAPVLVVRRVAPIGRASPAELQCFLL